MKTQRSDEILRGGSEHVNLEPPKWTKGPDVDRRLLELATESLVSDIDIETIKARTRSGIKDARRAASVALLRAMDQEPRSYLADVLRAVHANANRGELDDLLREAFGPSTAAKMRPRAWLDLRDRFAGRLYMGPESERWATDTELRQWLSAESSAESPFESGERIAGVALFAHLMAFVAGEV